MQTTDEAKTKENTKQKNTEQTKEKSKVKEKEYAINKDFHTPKFDVTVKRVVERVVERDKVGKESIGFQKPEDGHVFIAVEVEGKNITNESMKLAVLPSVDLVDENDNAYQSDVWAASTYAVEKGETSTLTKGLKPGEVMRESKVYVINKEKFDTGKWYVVVNNEYKEQIK